MNIPQTELDGWAALAVRVKQLVWSAQRATGAERNTLLEDAGHLAANLETRLERAGADKPRAVAAPRYETPIHLLDTPANRRYRDTLREAWEAGLAVDRERYGPDIGTDGCAQVIEMVLRDVEEEVGGTIGAGLE